MSEDSAKIEMKQSNSQPSDKVLDYTWTGLMIFGFIVFIVGLFLLVEASMYTKAEVGHVVSIDINDRVTVSYLDSTHQITGTMNELANLVRDDGTVTVWTMPKNPSNAVFTPNGVQTAGYVLISIGGAILITFMFVRLFVARSAAPPRI